MLKSLPTSKHVAAADIRVLYADLDYALSRAAMRPRDRSRIVLATSLAENAVTISDISWVLDSGLCRHQNEDDCTPYTLDYKASQTLKTNSRLLMKYWPRILLDRKVGRSGSNHQRGEAARAQFLKTLPSMDLLQLRGIKVAPAQWMFCTKQGTLGTSPLQPVPSCCLPFA